MPIKQIAQPATAEAKAAYLAGVFADCVYEWTSPEQFAEIKKRNVTAAPGVCHSHDFIDANMAMLNAFRVAFGYEPKAGEMTDEETALWNKAWHLATTGWLIDALPAPVTA